MIVASHVGVLHVAILVAILPWGRCGDDSNPLQSVVDQLVQRLSQLEARFEALQDTVSKLQPSVVFYVQHKSSPFVVNENSPVVFDNVVLNIGGGFSDRHFDFTTPVSGLYHLSFRGWSMPGHAGWLELQKNGVWLSELPLGDGDYVTADSQSMVLHLQQGDVLKVMVTSRIGQETSISLGGGDRTTFMGYLLKAD